MVSMPLNYSYIYYNIDCKSFYVTDEICKKIKLNVKEI